MINEENLNKLYDGLICDSELTTKTLNSYGFNSKDLSDLIDDNVLERVRRGFYSFLSIDDLYYYGKQLIANKEYNKATACFEKCFQLNPKHTGACFQLFLRKVTNREYEEAFKYFEQFYNADNEYYNSDSNFYLYLLNMITDIPEGHKKYARFIQFEDIKIDFNDKRYINTQAQNRIRTAALNQKFSFALKQLNDLIKQSGKLSVQDIITRTLLYQAAEIQNNIKNHVLSLINNKEYEEVINYLKYLDDEKGLSIADKYILNLTIILNDLIKTGKIPEKQIYSTDKLFEAIDGKNYELALSLSEDYLKKSNISENDNSMYILLLEINKYLTKNTKKEVSKEIVIEESIKEPQTIVRNSEQNTKNISNTFADVINYLMKNDLDNSFKTLKNYLKVTNKLEYEFLIVDLIKISLIENDIAFTKPMIALTYVSRENFVFDISEYIQNFYQTLSQNKFSEARIYLDIISKSNKLGQTCVLTEGLEQVLNTTEKLFNYQENNEILNKVEESLEKSEIQNVEINDEVSKESTESVIKETSTQFFKEKQVTNIESQNKDYDDESFISGKLEELLKNGIVLLRPMDSVRRKNIHKIVKNVSDVVSFSIGSEKTRRIVLRFKPYINEYIDLSKITKEGNEAYKCGDYDLCINRYRQLLEFGNPKSNVYAKLGLSYMKKYEKDLAIDYLTIASEMAKEENLDFDYSELIASLKGIISKEDRKPKFRMNANEFGNDLLNNYGVEDMDEALELISKGMSLEDLCTTLNLDEEQKSIVSLVFAKNCYAAKNYVTGDKYLKIVEKTKNKSKLVNSLFEEIRKNKKFYANRVDENSKKLILT